MSRRRHPKDTASATPTSPDPAGTREPSAPRLPSAPHLPPAPLPAAPRLPASVRMPSPLARPGRRTDGASETAMTQKLNKVPIDPTPAPLPPSPAAADAERWFEQQPTTPGAPRKDPSAVREVAMPPTPGVASPPAPTRPWLLPALLVATALTVGMILGALLFGRDGGSCPPCATAPK